MHVIPPELLVGPFHRCDALAAGVSARVLEGPRFVRVHPRVYRHRDHVMTFADDVRAAQLTLPDHAITTGVTRIQQLGLDVGGSRPLHFVVQGELHLALPGIFLHRTVQLPPRDNVGATPSAAFLAFCARARTIDAIEVGDWLLNGHHVSGEELQALALGQDWRAGAAEALFVLDSLDPRSRSIRESELRALLAYAGLPSPEVNRPVDLDGSGPALGDLWYPAWRTVVEYEGAQHQLDRRQYVADIDRYALYRTHGVGYVLSRSRSCVIRRWWYARSIGPWWPVGTTVRLRTSETAGGSSSRRCTGWSELIVACLVGR